MSGMGNLLLEREVEAIIAGPYLCEIEQLKEENAALKAVVDIVRAARGLNHIAGWEGQCICNTCKALAEYDKVAK